MKNARQQKILELSEKYDIGTQDTLIKKLEEEGFAVTQTTASRDIRQLNLVKGVTNKGTYKYVAPGAILDNENRGPALNASITDSVIKVEAAGNIVVVKTYSGLANAVAVYIDSQRNKNIVGCVAGDDTILLVVKTVEYALFLESDLKQAFGRK